MSDEFDDDFTGAPVGAAFQPRAADRVPRLVTRLFAAANGPLRAKLLACLLRPLSPLGMVAIAAGAFAGFVRRGGGSGIQVAIDDAARYSSEQITELARFVEQVSPEALQQFAALIADNPVGSAALSAAAVVLLLQALGLSTSAEPSNAAVDARTGTTVS